MHSKTQQQLQQQQQVIPQGKENGLLQEAVIHFSQLESLCDSESHDQVDGNVSNDGAAKILAGMVGGNNEQNIHRLQSNESIFTKGNGESSNFLMAVQTAIENKLFRCNYILLENQAITSNLIYQALLLFEFLQFLFFVFYRIEILNEFKPIEYLNSSVISIALDAQQQTQTQTTPLNTSSGTSNSTGIRQTASTTQDQDDPIIKGIVRVDSYFSYFNFPLIGQEKQGLQTFYSVVLALNVILYTIIGIVLLLSDKLFKASKNGEIKEGTRLMIKALSLIITLYLTIMQIPMFLTFFQGFLCDEDPDDVYIIDGVLCKPNGTSTTGSDAHLTLTAISVVTLIPFLLFVIVQILLYSQKSFDQKVVVPWAQFDQRSDFIKIVLRLTVCGAFMFDKIGNSIAYLQLFCGLICGFLVYLRLRGSTFYIHSVINQTQLFFEGSLCWLFISCGVFNLSNKSKQPTSISNVVLDFVAGIIFGAILVVIYNRKSVKVIFQTKKIEGKLLFYQLYALLGDQNSKQKIMHLQGYLMGHLETCQFNTQSCICSKISEEIDCVQELQEQINKVKSECGLQIQIGEKRVTASFNQPESTSQVYLMPSTGIESSKAMNADNVLSGLSAIYPQNPILTQDIHPLDQSIENQEEKKTNLSNFYKHPRIQTHLHAHQKTSFHNKGKNPSQKKVKCNDDKVIGSIADQLEEHSNNSLSQIILQNSGTNMVQQDSIDKKLSVSSDSRIEMILGEEVDSDETFDKSMFKFLSYLIDSSIVKESTGINLRIINSQIQRTQLGNQFKAIFDLMKCERSSPSIVQRFAIFSERIEIQKALLSSNSSSQGQSSSFSSQEQTMDIRELLVYEKMYQKYTLMEYVTANSALGFWRELLQKSLDSQAMQKRGSDISKSYAKIRQIADQLQEKKPNDIKFFYRYGSFLRSVMNNTFEALTVNDKGCSTYISKTTDRTSSKTSNEASSLLNENVATSIILISADPFQIGRVLHINAETKHLLGFSPKQLIGHSVGLMMPGIVACVHNKFIQNYLDTAQEKVLNRVIQMPAINQEGYLQIVRHMIKVYPQISDKIVFAGFMQNSSTYDLFSPPSKIDMSELKDAHYMITDMRGNIKAVTKGLFFTIGLHSKFFSQKEQFQFELNLSLINPDLMDPEIEENLESGDGNIMLLDTRDILQFIDLESLSQTQLEDVKSRLCVTQALIQMKKISFGEPGHRAGCEFKMYKIFLLNDESLFKVQGANLINETKLDVVNGSSIIREAQENMLNYRRGDIQDVNGPHHHSSTNIEVKNSIDHLSKAGSLSSNVRYFKKVVKDFKEDLAERSIPRSLRLLNKFLMILSLGLIALASTEYVMKVNTVGGFQAQEDQSLNSEIRFITLLQLTSNIRSLVNIANDLETDSYEGSDLQQLKRFEYLSGLIQDQADVLQDTHDILSQDRSDFGNKLDNPIAIHRVDLNNQVYKHHLQYRVALNTYLNYVQLLNNSNPSSLKFTQNFLSANPFLKSQNNTLTTSDQKNVMYLLLNGLRSLRERSMELLENSLSCIAFLTEKTNVSQIAISSICITSIVLSLCLISWQVTIQQRNKGDILSMYAEMKINNIKQLYNQTQQYMYKVLLEEGIISPPQSEEDDNSNNDTFKSLLARTMTESKAGNRQEDDLQVENDNRRIVKKRKYGNHSQHEEAFPGQLFYAPMVAEMLAFINHTLKKERIKELNQSSVMGAQKNEGVSRFYDSSIEDDRFNKSQSPMRDDQSDSAEQQDIQSSKRQLVDHYYGSLTDEVRVKRATKKANKFLERGSFSEHEEDSNNRSSEKRDKKSKKGSKSENFEEPPQKEEDIIQQRKRQIQSSLKSHNMKYHVGTWFIGVLMIIYFGFIIQYQKVFETDLSEFSINFPKLFDRYSYIMLSYEFVREKIMNSNSLKSFENEDSIFSPSDIDYFYKEQSLVTENTLAKIKIQSNSKLDVITNFQKESDSENFCANIIGEFKGQIEEKIVVTRNLEKKLKEIRRIAYQTEIQTVIAACNAASENKISVLKALHESNVDLNKGDYDRRTPLHVACSSGNFDIVQYLIEEVKVNINPIDRWGATPLCDAQPYPEIKKFLLNRNAILGQIQPPYQPNPVTVTDDQFRLFYAAYYGDQEMIDNLRLIGWNVNGQDYDGRTALGIAASEGQLQVVKYLVSKGADLSIKDGRGNDPLADARRENRTATIQYLSSIINESLIRGFCSQYHEGLLKQGMQQAVGNFHKKLADLQIQLASYPQNVSQSVLLANLNPTQTVQSTTFSEQQSENITILAGTLPTFFSVQELYFTKAIKELSLVIKKAYSGIIDDYLSAINVALIVFLVYQIIVLLFLRNRLIQQVNDEVFQSRGILNLVPEEFFEENPTTVEKLIKKLQR